jgi:hypothetical protein
LAIDPAVNVPIIETTVAPASNGRQIALPRSPVDPAPRHLQSRGNFVGCAQRLRHAGKTGGGCGSSRSNFDGILADAELVI